jgi:hypothetical protein
LLTKSDGDNVQKVPFVSNLPTSFCGPMLKPAVATFESIQLENPANPQSQSVTYFTGRPIESESSLNYSVGQSPTKCIFILSGI